MTSVLSYMVPRVAGLVANCSLTSLLVFSPDAPSVPRFSISCEQDAVSIKTPVAASIISFCLFRNVFIAVFSLMFVYPFFVPVPAQGFNQSGNSSCSSDVPPGFSGSCTSHGSTSRPTLESGPLPAKMLADGHKVSIPHSGFSYNRFNCNSFFFIFI